MTPQLPEQISTTLLPDSRWDITGVILVGGKNRRMGKDKAIPRLRGRRLKIADVIEREFLP
jgi:CTP:molybdopterin cytidylyltransferase MocA